jgi:hypothetical protein
MCKIGALTGLLAIGLMFMTPALAYDQCPPGYAADGRNPQECVRLSGYRSYPAACESVWFPRSPLCGDRAAPAPVDWHCWFRIWC